MRLANGGGTPTHCSSLFILEAQVSSIGTDTVLISLQLVCAPQADSFFSSTHMVGEVGGLIIHANGLTQ